MPDSKHHEILILGAGPGGLVLGQELKRHGVPFSILEQGSGPGDSWRRMPVHMKLVSPWRANVLPNTASIIRPPHYEMSRDEFHRYLQQYSREHELPVQTNVHVQHVSRDQGCFQLRTSQGRLSCRFLVNATGYFSKPYVPELPGAAQSGIPQLHIAHYGEPQRLRETLKERKGLVLIVGKRLSAGQLLLELVDAGFETALSHRAPIQFGAGRVGWWIFFRIFPEIERLKLLLAGTRARGFDVRMPGGRTRRLIESGTVKTFPEIRRFDGDTVEFVNGTRLQPAAVIYATGYRPALDHLRSILPELSADVATPLLANMESVSVPGLFFLGLKHQRNLQSEYIRGIRRDAVMLARRLCRRLERVPSATECPAASPGLATLPAR